MKLVNMFRIHWLGIGIEPTNKEILGYNIKKNEICMWEDVFYSNIQKYMANIHFQQRVEPVIYKLHIIKIGHLLIPIMRKASTKELYSI